MYIPRYLYSHLRHCFCTLFAFALENHFNCHRIMYRYSITKDPSKGSFICHSPLLPIAGITACATPHLPSVEKLSSTKKVPGAKKVGDRCFRESQGSQTQGKKMY